MINKMNRPGWFIVPYWTLFGIFIILPVIAAIGLSFTYFNSIETPRFIGIQNYIELITTDTVFMKYVLPNTLKFSLIVGPIGYLMSFFLAWMLAQISPLPRTVLAIIFYSPSLTLGVAMADMWRIIFSGDAQGYLNAMLMNVGIILEPIQYLQSPVYLMTIMIVISLWSSMGVGFLAMLAGILNIDQTLYEAAYVDGIKNRTQEILYITLPSMKPQLLFGAVMAVVTTFQAGMIGVMLSGTNPTPQYAGQLIVNHIEDFGFIRYMMGYAAAISVVLLIMVYAISKVTFNILGEGSRDGKRRSSFQGMKINPSRFHRSQIPFYSFLIPFSTLMLLPILFIFNHAFKPISELFAYPPRFFVRQPTFDNFLELSRITSASGVPFSRYIFNSLLVTIVGVLAAILITSLSAYGLSKLKFKGKQLLFEINTLALMFVPIAVIIPRYFIIARSGLIDNYLGHILPVIVLPVAMFLLKQFIDQLPNELIESAKIDGASEMKTFFSIVFPIVFPAIATVGILAFQVLWNDTSTSILFINDESKRTLAFYMMSLTSAQGNTVAGQGMAAAASLIMFVPNLILFIFLQSRVMNTMAHSGIK